MGFCLALLVFRLIKSIVTPESIKPNEIISACDGWNPRKGKVVFTRIFSIRKRSSPFTIKYQPNNWPALGSLFLIAHKKPNRISPIKVS